MHRLVPIHVRCHEGSRADETPLWFTLNERRLDIEEIVDRWYQASADPTAGSAAYFKVRTMDGGVHLLRLDHQTFAWNLVEAP